MKLLQAIYKKIFANGVHSYGNSNYGNQMEQLMQRLHFYWVDVGLAGFYYLFGILGISGMFLLFFKKLIFPVNSNKLWDKYFLMFVILTSLTNGILLYQGKIISICIAVYVIEN